MLLRIRQPGQPPRDQDLGPAPARTHDYWAERRTVDHDRTLPSPWMRGLHPGGDARREVRS